MAFVTLFDIAGHDMGQARDERELAVFTGMAGRKGAPMPPPPPDQNVFMPGMPGQPVGVPVPGMMPTGAPGMPPGIDPVTGAPIPSSAGGFSPGGDAGMPTGGAGGMETFSPSPVASGGSSAEQPTILGIPRMQAIMVAGGLGLLVAAIVVKKVMRKPQPPQYWGPPPTGWSQPQAQPATPQPTQAPQPPVTRNSRRSVQYEADLGAPGHVEEVVMTSGGLAELRRFTKRVATFRPTDSQRRKIASGKGVIRITSGQIKGR